jgi:hypothetical protein
MTRSVERVVYSIPTDMRVELEQLVEQSVAENSGQAVGAPTIRFDGTNTLLEVDRNEWWDDLMKRRHLQLVLLAVNRVSASRSSNKL